jgi:hypothetical protein
MRTPQRRQDWIAAAIALSAVVSPATGSSAEERRFEKLSVFLERNVQDRDAEIRFEVTAAEEGLAALKVSAPDKRTVIDVRTPDSKLGIRKLAIESPEPADDSVVRADFPAGAYRFEGKTTKGASLHGEARLSHGFPEAATFGYPQPGQRDVAPAALTLRWSAPEGIESCVIVLEQTGSPYEIRAVVPGWARAFTIPAGFLRAGQTYTFAIGTVAKDGNRSFIEANFATARTR